MPFSNYAADLGNWTDLLPILKRQVQGDHAYQTEVNIISQWRNPSDVSSILMVIGGDLVQKALAQSAGMWFTPVCFSFGWVSYAFSSLVNVVGDGRLLPQADYPVKVFNLDSGYCRQNKHWMIGRLLRDQIAMLDRKDHQYGRQCGIRISIFAAEKNTSGATKLRYGTLHYIAALTMMFQLIVAAIPVVLQGQWNILLTTGIGTLLVLTMGCIPQWSAEKLPNSQMCRKTFGLTSGNGSQDIIVIFGSGKCLDLEELSTAESPRSGRPWLKFPWLSVSQSSQPSAENASPHNNLRRAKMFRSLPQGFWITRIVVTFQSVCWLLLLVNVAAIKSHTWYLLAVGAIGMFQNAILAGMPRSNEDQNIPMRLVETIYTNKVMDGLMDLEVLYHCGRHLVPEFFPGPLRADEDRWWEGKVEEYDSKRRNERHHRGLPRSETAQPEDVATKFWTAAKYPRVQADSALRKIADSDVTSVADTRRTLTMNGRNASSKDTLSSARTDDLPPPST